MILHVPESRAQVQGVAVSWWARLRVDRGGVMAWRAPRLCPRAGCTARTEGGLCIAHKAQQMRALDAQRPTAAARGYGYGWRKRRAAFLEEHPTCACGRPATLPDHDVSRRRGGGDEDANLVPMCATCHGRKTALVDGALGAKSSGILRELDQRGDPTRALANPIRRLCAPRC